MDIINYLLSLDTIEETMKVYHQFESQLEGCKFIFFSNEIGADLPAYMLNNSIGGFKINSLTSSTKIFVIDNNTYREMIERKKANYKIDLCIAFDTQLVSYLSHLFNESDTREHAYKEVIDYIIKNDIECDVLPYILENSSKINTKEEIEAIYLNLLAIEKFEHLDRVRYKLDGSIEYDVEESIMLVATDERFRRMREIGSDENTKMFNNTYNGIKAMLLKMAMIEFKNPKKGIKYKLNEMLCFINNELGYFLEREIAICYLFFKYDNRVQKFFKKIKYNCSDIIKHIDGMAWDLNHLRHIENMMAYYSQGDNYSLYSIITFDYGLQEVLSVYPIKKCVMHECLTRVVFENNLNEFIGEVVDVKNLISSNTNKREEVRKTVDLKSLVVNLEEELKSLMRKNGIQEN
ncbi:MAG: hypothetical protein ACRC6T_07900 [Sarcina sp.]